MTNLDWTLRECCERGQFITLGIIVGWTVVVGALWYTSALLPLKMLVVFLHELSHAIATWLTCGKVEAIEVHKSEGGVTRSRGGCMCVILPAGYLGSCFWGIFFLLMGSYNIWTMRISAGVLCFLLAFVTAVYARNWSFTLVCLFFLAVIISAWIFTEVFTTVWPLRIALLLIGVMSMLYSVLDIFDDLIRRTEKESDAYKCAKLTNCNSRLCGVLWALLAICIEIFAIYIILVDKAIGREEYY